MGFPLHLVLLSNLKNGKKKPFDNSKRLFCMRMRLNLLPRTFILPVAIFLILSLASFNSWPYNKRRPGEYISNHSSFRAFQNFNIQEGQRSQS